MDYFDIYDLDRLILTDGGKVFDYERIDTEFLYSSDERT